MVTASGLRKDMDSIIRNGDQIRLKFYAGSVSATDFDDAQVLVASGTDIWTSGLIFPIKGVTSSEEAVLLAQGKITHKDKVLYINGNQNISGDAMKIGIGSPNIQQYSIVPDGITDYRLGGNESVYKKMFIRALPNGSFIGEM